MNKEHKETTRTCPGCSKTKTYQVRHECCSPACAVELRKRRNAIISKSNTVPPLGAEETHEQAGDSWEITLPKTRISTLEELLDHCKVDLAIWEVERFIVNKWEMGSKDADGRPQTTPLFQVKAFLRRSAVKVSIAAEIASLKADAKLAMPERPARGPEPASSGIMVEISIPDLHMGKLAWAKETGHANYDSEIAASEFRSAVHSILDRTQGMRPEVITLVVGNDVMNADNMQLTTTRGTPQHSDVRYQKTFRTTRLMISEAITTMTQLAQVWVVMVPGNHDTLATWHLGDSLECFFDRNAAVAVDNQPSVRKYQRWGQVMLMWTHGDKGKHSAYPLLMATEQREMFGATSWHEIHLGHLHQISTREINGVRVRVLPSLCAPDAWHSEMGYVGNVRSAEAYIWHRDQGLVGTAVYVSPDYDKRVLPKAA